MKKLLMKKLLLIAGNTVFVLIGLAGLYVVLVLLPERVLIALILLVLIGQFVNMRALKKSFVDLCFAIAGEKK